MPLTAIVLECAHKIIFKFYLSRTAEELRMTLRQFFNEFTHDLINDDPDFLIS